LPVGAHAYGHNGIEEAAGRVSHLDAHPDRELLVAVELDVVHVGATGGDLRGPTVVAMST
jgi:hypothetical protein